MACMVGRRQESPTDLENKRVLIRCVGAVVLHLGELASDIPRDILGEPLDDAAIDERCDVRAVCVAPRKVCHDGHLEANDGRDDAKRNQGDTDGDQV